MKRIKSDKMIWDVMNNVDIDKGFLEVASDIINYMEKELDTSHCYLIEKDEKSDEYKILIKHDREGSESNLSVFSTAIEELCCSDMLYVNSEDEEYSQLLKDLKCSTAITSPIHLNGSIAYYIAILDDGTCEITDKKLFFIQEIVLFIRLIAGEKLNNSSEKSTNNILREILSNIATGIMVFDKERKTVLFTNDIVDMSEEHTRILMDAMKSVIEDDETLIPKRPLELFDAESGLWFDVAFSRLVWIDGREVILISSKDTTLKKKNSTKSTFQAQNDFLTGLYNRMKCEMDLKKNIEQCKKAGTKGAILFIDLDNFKNINDSLGHDYGDALLQEIGAMLQSTTGVRNHCYRMGGDEFVVIVTPEHFSILEKILINISTEFNKSWYLIDSECYCTMSMGIAIFPDNGEDANELIKKSDIAMYDAKRTGKNRYSYYDDKFSSENNYRRLEVESSMRQAVEGECEEFVVFYQPIVDTESSLCIGCESLVRWNSKALGFIGPGEFIPLAEYLGLIVDIGDYVLEKACIQCREWNEKYDDKFRVNVNLSVVQLLQQDVVTRISNIIYSTGVNPENITLEITENLAINDMARVRRIIKGLKKIGVKIALDDFGTGYSSLNYIKDLDFDIIKIDKSFVEEICKDDYERAFVKLIADLSRQIGAKLCVEGIETIEQFNVIREIQADSVQGFYFSKPIPPEEFETRFFSK